MTRNSDLTVIAMASGRMFERGAQIASDTRRSPAWRERAVLREGMRLLAEGVTGPVFATALLMGYGAQDEAASLVHADVEAGA